MKYVRILLLLCVGFLNVSFAQAIDESNIHILGSAVLGGTVTELNASISLGIDDVVDFWFEYGITETDMTTKTEKVTWEKRGYYYTDARIENLSPNTLYYFVGVISVDGEVSKTDSKTFKTFSDPSASSVDSNIEMETPQGIINPFDYFNQGNNNDSDISNADENSNHENQTESTPIEYQEDPVGGVVNDESVYYSDEDPDIIEYSDEYRNRFKKKQAGNGSGLLVIMLLILVIILFFIYRKVYGKHNQYRSHRKKRLAYLNTYRHPEHTMQNKKPDSEHTTFFRKPPQK